MAKQDDDAFNMDDVMQIFGEKLEIPVAEPAAPPAKTAVATASTAGRGSAASSPAKQAVDETDSISAEEMRILEEYERAKKGRHAQEEEARRKKEREEQRILEEYERQKKEAAEKAEKERKEREEKQRREIEALKSQQAQEEKRKEEERRIIEEYEKERQASRAKEASEREARESKAQAELKALAEKQKAEEQRRLAEEKAQASKLEADLKQKAAATTADSTKERRLLELLAKAQQEISSPSAPPPLAPLPKIIQNADYTKQSAASAGASAPASYVEIPMTIGGDENTMFAIMFDVMRKTCFSHLAPMIGIKATNTMLSKTVEKARAKTPAILKDVNWKMDGSLREDGSIDMDRLYKNANQIPLGERVEMYFRALREILLMRLQAVELGLGAHVRSELFEKMNTARHTEFTTKGFQPRLVQLFYQEVVSPKG